MNVGIFWFVPTPRGSRILYDMTPLSAADVYGDMLTHDRGHAEFWDHLAETGTARLQAAGWPTAPGEYEYDDFPRGRVVYDRRESTFIAYADRQLQTASFRAAIALTFGLGDQAVIWKLDSHYARSRRIPQVAPSQKT